MKRTVLRMKSLEISCLTLISVLFVALASRPEKCYEPVQEGTCQEQQLRWFYNDKSNTCQTFVYSGCGGNANNFNSTMYCLHACNGTAANTHTYVITGATKTEEGGKGGESDKTVKTRSKRNLSINNGDDDHKTIDNGVDKQRKLGKDSEFENQDIEILLKRIMSSIEKLEKAVNHQDVTKSAIIKSARPTISGILKQKAKKVSTNDHETEDKQSQLIEQPGNAAAAEDNDEEAIKNLDKRIQGIIKDPSFVFSCNNITAPDKSTLKEVVLEI